jgi:hypothetical protein
MEVNWSKEKTKWTEKDSWKEKEIERNVKGKKKRSNLRESIPGKLKLLFWRWGGPSGKRKLPFWVGGGPAQIEADSGPENTLKSKSAGLYEEWKGKTVSTDIRTT